MNNKKNAISSIALQIATIVQGLILPRLILSAFGSEVNGLISSITQFLSFISLLEGGLGAVVLAELYMPIEQKDETQIRSVLVACQKFFNKLAIIFIAYTVILSFVYPIFIVKSFSFAYTSSMVVILSLTTLTQYLFSITYKLYLQADQKLYVVNIVSTVTILLNTVVAAIIIFFIPDVHVVKLASGIIYLIQPIALKHFAKKSDLLKQFKGRIKNDGRHEAVLANRWSGFSQNLAHFINMNTDAALLTFFFTLGSVSVYTVYMLAINALRGIITSVGNSYQSALGKYIAEGDTGKLKYNFEKFENVFWFGGTVCFGTCMLLINGFVSIYTNGIEDTNYYQPVFAAVIVLANMIYVIREPYRLLVLAAGKFRETNFGAIDEAVLNLVISFLLIQKYDLTGIAIGTLIATAFRLIYFIWYLRKDILYKRFTSYYPNLISSILTIFVDGIVYKFYSVQIDGFGAFCVFGIVFVCFNVLLYLGLHYLMTKLSALLSLAKHKM